MHLHGHILSAFRDDRKGIRFHLPGSMLNFCNAYPGHPPDEAGTACPAAADRGTSLMKYWNT
jgi:hypothetical protein